MVAERGYLKNSTMPRYTRVFFYKEFLATCDVVTARLTEPQTTRHDVLELMATLHELLDLYEAKCEADIARHTRFSEFEKLTTIQRERAVVEERGGLIDFATQNWFSTNPSPRAKGTSVKSEYVESRREPSMTDVDDRVVGAVGGLMSSNVDDVVTSNVGGMLLSNGGGITGESHTEVKEERSKSSVENDMFGMYGYDYDDYEEERMKADEAKKYTTSMFSKVQQNEKKKRDDERERQKKERRTKFIDDLAASIHRQFGHKLNMDQENVQPAQKVVDMVERVHTSTPLISSLKKKLSFSNTLEQDYEEDMPTAARFNLSDRLMGYGNSERMAAATSRRETMDADDSQSYISRVSLPDFDGKDDFSLWWSTFETLVDKSNEPIPIKFLRLKNCLKGEAYDIVKFLPHDAQSYELAKNKLLDHFGGEQRNVYRLYNEAAAFAVIEKEDDLLKLRQLSCLIMKIIRTMIVTKQEHEVGQGALCFICTSKIPPEMIMKFHEWRDRKHEGHTLKSLGAYLEEAIARRTTAMETVYGVQKRSVKKSTERTGRTMMVEGKDSSNKGAGDSKQKQISGGLKKKCRFCAKNHYIWDCEDFKRSANDEKWKKVRELNLCTRCLSFKHGTQSCTSTRTCGVNKCNAKHHRLLHDESRYQQWLASRNPSTTQAKESDDKNKGGDTGNVSSGDGKITDTSQSVNAVLTAENYSRRHIALRTVPVLLVNGKRRARVNALLDDGSCFSFVNRNVADYLQLSGEDINTNVQVFEGNSIQSTTQLVTLTVESVDGKYRHTDMAELTDHVVGNMQAFEWNTVKNRWPHLADIRFPEISKPNKVDVLLGANFMDLIASRRDVVGDDPQHPQARLTKLGWTCIGETDDKSDNTHVSYGCWSSQDPKERFQVEAAIEQMWSWEEPNEKSSYKTKMEAYAEEQVMRSLKKVESGYQVAIPYKYGQQPYLPNNYQRAYARMIATEKQLRKHPEAAKQYNLAFRDYIAFGYFEVVINIPGIKGKIWYLVHFPVIRWDKASSKVRPVYDPGDEYQGRSLSDEELIGPKYQQDLVKVLLRFRRYMVAVGSDIAKMYMQVWVEESERDYQRVLWRWMDESKEPTVYRSTRVVFGRKSSPYLALKVARENALKHEKEYPKAASTILESTYMDDSLDSERTDEEAIELKTQLVALWGIAGMRPGKWMSNSAAFLQTVPEEDRAEKVDILRSVDAKVKTLGLWWHALLDYFAFIIKVSWDGEVTKRKFLKLIAGIFDPLGMLLPVLIRGRILLQDLWLEGCDWDDVVTGSSAVAINSWVDELPSLEEIRIPRVLIVGGDCRRFLHVIGDASGMAYGAVGYLVVWYADRRTSKQVYAKGKVAPSKTVSTPRLELQAAVVCTEVKEKVYETLEVPEEDIYYWSDSMDVIYWSRSQSRNHKPFVANRISVIHERSLPKKWGHIAGSENPADVLSRGCEARALETDVLWWNGPEFLLSNPEDWPKVEIDESVKPKEMRVVKYTFCNYCAVDEHAPLVSLTLKISRLPRLIRVMAYVLRFLLDCAGSTVECGTIKLEEKRESLNALIRTEQRNHFRKEVECLHSDKCNVSTRSKISRFLPWIDDEGIMRSMTRLQAAKYLAWEIRNPIILPRYGRLTYLIIINLHENEGHAGIGATLNAFRMKYMCVADREVVREALGTCIKCKKATMQPVIQRMGNLPACRIDVRVRPFQSSSVDLAGPFETVQGRGRVRAKRWMCLFACTVTRAVHIEMAYSLSTDDFMLVLERFTFRRGVPEDLYADNGTNFIGADNVLQTLKEEWKLQEIEEKAAAYEMKWHFQPPAAPHHGGAHESLIKVAKRQLYRILSKADLRDQELMTAFTKVEGYMNKRPMSYCSNPFTDEPVLTPGHFLFGEAAVDPIPADDGEFARASNERWRRVQELLTHYWDRFIPEWITTLGPRKKWFKTFENVAVDDIVLVPDLSERKGHWPLGRVVKTYPGADGLVRVVDVQVREKTYRRPIVRLHPLLKG